VRTWLVVLASVVAVALVFGGLWAAGALIVDDDSQSAGTRSTMTSSSTTRARDAAPPPCRTPLTPDEPLRLWIGGDSLAGSLGPSLGKQTAATGVVQPVYDSRVSSGLSTPDFFDWPEHATEEMARLDPEIVVFIIGANDWNVPRSTPTDESGEPAWKGRYADAVEEMLDVLNDDDDDRPVYWVGAPPMQERRKDSGVREVNLVARAVISEHPEAAYIDDYALFAGDDGGYSATLETEDGRSVRMRAADGVHFTVAGGEHLARAVFQSVDARCHIDDQAVEGQDQRVIETPGSGRLPSGGSGGGSSGSGSSGGATVSTSPPTQAPTTVPTQPPTTGTTLPPISLGEAVKGSKPPRH
jgi:hypothetical protein